MPEFTYAVTQNVHYYGGVEFDSADEVLEMVETGDWDDSKNEVKWDRVQVYDLDGKLVADTGSDDVTVWTMTVNDGGHRFHTVTVYGSKDEAEAAFRANYADEQLTEEEAEESKGMSIDELANFLSLDVAFDSHVVRLP